MLELMHGSLGGVRPTFPNSGPGTKLLQFGDDNLGYFGEVSGAELFTAKEFIALANASFGVRETAAESISQLWFKFFHKGKVIYIAKYPFVNTASWEDIYKAGLVYGTMSNGKYPVVGAETWQYNPLIKAEGGKEWTLIPRMMKGVAADPYSALDTTTYAGSEYTELFGRLLDVTNAPVDEKWARFSMSDVGLVNTGSVRYMGLQETQASNVANALYAGTGAASGFGSRGPANKTTANLQYRAVLQLVSPSDGLIPADSIEITPVGPAQIYLYDLNVANQGDPNLGVENIYVENFATKEIRPTYTMDTNSALRPTDIMANDDTSTWASFTIAGSYVP